MSFDKQIFEQVLNYTPDFQKDQDVIAMNSIWYFLETYGATCYIYDEDLDDVFLLTKNGVLHNSSSLYLEDQGEYLQSKMFSSYGKAIIKAIKLALEKNPQVNKTFLLNGMAGYDYIKHFNYNKNVSTDQIFKNEMTDHQFIVDQVKESLNLVHSSLLDKSFILEQEK